MIVDNGFPNTKGDNMKALTTRSTQSGASSIISGYAIVNDIGKMTIKLLIIELFDSFIFISPFVKL
jgi:uncharacterized phosphosugar-binding protein